MFIYNISYILHFIIQIKRFVVFPKCVFPYLIEKMRKFKSLRSNFKEIAKIITYSLNINIIKFNFNIYF